jgi:hypothetical protein
MGGLVTTRIEYGVQAVTLVHGNAVTINASGGGDYSHTQATAAATWTVNHNLGRRPAVTVMTAGGLEVLAEVLHTSVNQVLVTFDQPTAGLAVCS